MATFVATACAGASGPAPPRGTAPNGESPVARVARQCAIVASCSDEHDSSVFRTPQACVDWYLVNAKDEAPLAECMMRANDCAHVEACTHMRADAVAEQYCKAHPGVLTACEGDRLVSCEGDASAESLATDCAALGGTCGERKEHGLVERGCISPRLCPPGAPEHRCDGEHAVVDCSDGIADRNACPPNTRCVADRDESGAPSVRCRSASGRDCTVAGAAFCEGDVAFACVQNGRFSGLHSADCGAFGLACVVRAGHVSCVRDPLAHEAQCTSRAAACAGDTLVFCAAGESFRVSCTQLGFTRCDPSGGGGEALCASPHSR